MPDGASWTRVTPRMLLAHTAGVADRIPAWNSCTLFPIPELLYPICSALDDRLHVFGFHLGAFRREGFQQRRVGEDPDGAKDPAGGLVDEGHRVFGKQRGLVASRERTSVTTSVIRSIRNRP
jgi:hypothetical protein